MSAWDESAAGSTEVEQVVYLSNLIGADVSLVQPGGGNTSVKVEEVDGFGCTVQALVVKGSGTDLRTIGASGFTHLYLERLDAVFGRRGEGPSPGGGRKGERRSPLRDSISDEVMMSVMRGCMLAPDRDPLPSVETPLHSLLPARFVAHTHDVATLSLTDTPSAAEHVRRVFGDGVTFLEYVRPGVPLAKRLAKQFPEGPPADAKALVMEKHGLAVWGETAKECWEILQTVIAKAEEYVAEAAKGKRVFGAARTAALENEQRLEVWTEILPVIRGELMRAGFPCVLVPHSRGVAEAISSERFAEVASRGVMTPEHILRAGVRPLVVSLASNQTPVDAIRNAIRTHRDQYAAYAERHGVTPIADYLKTIAIPGLGIVYAGKERRNALVAGECYSATMRVMAGAEAVERFEFLPEEDAFEVEYWPLERLKIEEPAKARKDLEGKVAVVIGAASGIGKAAVLRFAAEGAHVFAFDRHPDVHDLSRTWERDFNERVAANTLDVTDPEEVSAAIGEAVMAFGGIDVLFYSPGIAPELHSVTEMPEEEVERQMAVHYRGAVAATREVSKVMLAQGTGGRLVYNASKSAFVPGEGAAAYGASKAALVHYVRNVAKELGSHGITANYVNADTVDTPLFRGLLRRRAEAAGISEEAMLERYAERSVLREALVPPEAVAEAALWLASERSAHTTGCVITLGGGAEGFPR